ncbi:hypothetical protein LVB77_15690 [Lysobacter sp. 5GHs7-4]|uniref:hypothetical protein n=1 Tax=Lysobacter sp. 5GHs7-4 TaxID=2904253 RepID=UPI001E526850|nr:hypothetical protein [Lysobacter sp. 5GHs7-4]UHQ22100.1 hypothetical protein LVB77_15690 [Lysobacter sp. 5GHs7-4]
MARQSHPTGRAALFGLLCCVWGAAGAGPVERYDGLAYARDGARLLYRETHWRYAEQGVGHRLVLYRCPGGEAFARKRVVDGASAAAPDFDFSDGRDGYREGVRSRGDGREVYVQDGARAPLRSRALSLPRDAVIDAGFDAMVRARWDALSPGRAIAVPFLLPSRFDFLDLKLAAAAPARVDGRGARRLRMSLDRWYGFAIPAIELTYADADRRLLEFRGIGTIRDRRGRHLDVRIAFPADAVSHDATRAEVERATTMPLARNCGAGSPSV